MAVGQSFFESSFHFKHFSVNFSLSPARSSRGDISHHKMLFSFSSGIFHTYASLSAYGGKTKSFLDSFLGYCATFREEMTACLLRYLSSYLPCLTLGSCFCHRTLGCWGFADSELSQIHVTKHRPYPAPFSSIQKLSAPFRLTQFFQVGIWPSFHRRKQLWRPGLLKAN